MTFTESVQTCLTKYANGGGRACRPEYWWFALAMILASILGDIVDALTNYPILGPLISLGLLLPSIAAATRRLHDTDRSGWWQLIVLVPLIGVIVLIVWLASKGTPGRNRFGPEPGTIG